ncbi:hypothetical protein L1987_36277 [Smallanthus sonchifolius]|uniref:Uncharacterized protein n=1 Tax=Smallanthus sonchifolius TaxID=185202 RepID=A0ACB9HD53_9ASTR|nr:hypothetical protein L1987_36277 [Smallanthus sonchifolius]
MAITLSTLSPVTRTNLSPATNSPHNYTTRSSNNLTLPPPLTPAKSLLLLYHMLAALSPPPSLAPPARTSQSSIETGNLLERVEVFNLNGNSILITDLWKDRKAVVAFARHFGCVLCRKRADMLAAKKDRMDASGVALVLIGPGSVDQAGLSQSKRNLKEAALKIIEAYMEGYRQDWELSFEKDTRTRGGWQQGGIMVAGPGISNISYIHKDKEAGDDPDVEEILKACCS